MLVLNSEEPNQEELRKAQEAAVQEVLRNMNEDLKKREEVGLKPRLINDFENKELREIYRTFLHKQV